MAFNKNVTTDVNFFNGMFNASSKLAADPYITGYGYAIWLRYPKCVDAAEWKSFEKMFYQNFRSLEGISDITLETTNLGFGFANNESNFASTIQKGNTEFSVNHVELSGSIMRKFYENWIFAVRDPLLGVSTYSADGKTPYSEKNHTGDLLYFTTKPVLLTAENIKDILEFACVYRNVMPKNVPLNQMNMSEGSHDTVNFSQSFKGDMFYNSNIMDFVISKVTEIKTVLDTSYKLKTLAEIKVLDDGNVDLDFGK